MRGMRTGVFPAAAGGNGDVGAGDGQAFRRGGNFGPGEEKGVEIRLSGKLQLMNDGVQIVKEDEVDAAVGIAVGKIAGTQLPGEKHRGTGFVEKLIQLGLGQGFVRQTP